MQSVNMFKLRFWVIAFVIAIGMGVLLWEILEIVFPHDSLALLSLKKTTNDYNLKMLATGLAFFGLINIILAIVSPPDSDKATMGNNWGMPSQDVSSKVFDGLCLSIRIVLAGYFVLFWVNYVPHAWFKHISLVIGVLGIEFWSAISCVIIVSLICGYLIIEEPWRKLVMRANKLWAIRLAVYIIISLPLYFLGLVNVLYNTLGIILITIGFVTVFIVFMIWKRNIDVHIS